MSRIRVFVHKNKKMLKRKSSNADRALRFENKKNITGIFAFKASENKQGFSLVEVLFSLTILSVGIIAVVLMMSSNIKNSITAKNQVIASELAQEGVELVVNFKKNDPLRFVSTNMVTRKPDGSNYLVDVNTTYAEFAENSSQRLNINNNSGVYSHSIVDPFTPTKFYRRIEIKNNIAPVKTIIVTSFVTWNGIGFALMGTCNIANKCVSIEATLPD